MVRQILFWKTHIFTKINFLTQFKIKKLIKFEIKINFLQGLKKQIFLDKYYFGRITSSRRHSRKMTTNRDARSGIPSCASEPSTWTREEERENENVKEGGDHGLSFLQDGTADSRE